MSDAEIFGFFDFGAKDSDSFKINSLTTESWIRLPKLESR
jgi:hypothetical protein